MKVLKYITVLLCTLTFIGCESDRDSNPTFQEPTEFVLNTPKYADGKYVLKETESILLTCSQPDYGFAAATTYEVQVSLTEDFAASHSLVTTYTTARMEISALELATVIVNLLGVTVEENFPSDNVFDLYVRLESSIKGVDGSEILSNSVNFTQIESYFALDALELPTEMFVNGLFYENWNWEKSFSMVPIHSKPGKFWGITYIEGGTGDDNGIKFNWTRDWNETDVTSPFGGGDNVTITSRDGFTQSANGGGNIVMAESGWHVVVLTATIDEMNRQYTYNVEFLEPNVYIFGPANGGSYDPSDEWIFTIPNDGTGEFVSPTLLESSELRMCIKIEESDWWQTEFIFYSGKIAYRGAGNDQARIPNEADKKVYLNFLTGKAGFASTIE